MLEVMLQEMLQVMLQRSQGVDARDLVGCPPQWRRGIGGVGTCHVAGCPRGLESRSCYVCRSSSSITSAMIERAMTSPHALAVPRPAKLGA